jgi:hypothetical protein
MCVCVHKTIKLGNDPKTVAMAAATTTVKTKQKRNSYKKQLHIIGIQVKKHNIK